MMKKILAVAVVLILVSIEGTQARSEPSAKGSTQQAVELDQTDLLEIYPNPVSEYLNISQQHFDGETSQLEIIDLSGNIVYEVKERFTQLSIFVGNWQKGIYLVFFCRGDVKVTHKIVVE